MKAWFQRFMYGRYGQDNLNQFLSMSALMLYILSMVARWSILNSMALVFLLFSVYRMLSRNLEQRRQENFAFLRAKSKVMVYINRINLRLRWRKTHRYYQCPSCKQSLRVPKGKGNIVIHCPKCHTSFEKRT